jgi:DNA polymerase III subunit delta
VASLKPEQVDDAIRSGRIGKVYLFDGPETFLKERAIQRIVEKLVTPESRDFNLDRFDGLSCTGGQIVTAVQSLPFLGERRVVVVTAADELSAADSRLVGEAMNDLPDSTCLLMVWEGKANLREEIPAQASSVGAIVTCWTPFPNLLPSWIMNEARVRGKPIAPDAAAALCEACSDLQQIVNEYEKLSLYVGKKPKIEMSDVREHGLPDEEGDYKDLEEALFSRDLGGTLRQAHLLAESGLRPESIYPVFERVFRMLVLAQHFRDEKRAGIDEIFASLGIRGKTQQANLARAMNIYKPGDARDAFDRIAQADYELKTGILSGSIGVSLLAMAVLGKRDGASVPSATGGASAFRGQR